MKIGILTQPLYNNYGGLLQNYALQTVLKKMGHEPITIDCIPQNNKMEWMASTMKSMLLWPIKSKRRRFASFPKPRLRNDDFNRFVEDNIDTTSLSFYFSDRVVKDYGLDMIVVGSDQVWRPRYSPHVEEGFLAFLHDIPVRRVAYAASFGVDTWEMTDRQTRRCRKLVQRFEAVSVREASGVALCEQYLHVKADVVLDPTLLLQKEDYERLLDPQRPHRAPFLAAYILDDSPANRTIIEQEAADRGLELCFFTAGKQACLSITEWLTLFHDAAYVVTDSFHGTVFSIVFGKEFRCLTNSKRGNSRFENLLGMVRDGTLETMRKKSYLFLKEHIR